MDIRNGVHKEVIFSIETRYASVAEKALKGGWDIVNDICGFADTEMPNILGQVLIYPGLGGDSNKGSYVRHANAPLLSRNEIVL